ncbi:sensor histidine kinase [Duganella callida]|uniref:Histidine kinase/HSP90-like ATPase domain-containing protein n=1 Tax=Duganella callida TaxID=2561932 RepID=A0A4Y9S844_9BURK|nr:sensor histidine kinase [Duganella callida]TFW17728.1 hypothetical protein E4L98_19865 [Duganella callida]
MDETFSYCRAIVACVVFAVGAAPALCQSRAAPVAPSNLHHTSWTARDGAPESVLSITQTRDGWLWLGGPGGLVRFDGMRFEQFVPGNGALPTTNVSLVNAVAGEALWIGYRTGGASVLRNGLIRNYGERDGLPPRAAVWGLERDGGGRMWAATSTGLWYLERERWQPAAAAWGLAGGSYKTLMRDRRGVLWAQGDAGVYALQPGARQFTRAGVDSGTGVLFELPDGNVISWDALHSRLHLLTGPQANTPYRAWGALGDPGSLLVDRHGDLWVGQLRGLEQRTGPRMTLAAPQQGLSGHAVGALFEDQEGNVWAATSRGVDRFRHRRVTRLNVPDATISGGLIADDRGGVWIGSYHVVSDESGHVTAKPLWTPGTGEWDKLLTSFARGADGVLWGASYGALRRFGPFGGRPVALPSVPGGARPRALLAQRDGSLLAALVQHGLYRRDALGNWEKFGPDGEVNAMAGRDAAGLWLAYQSGVAARADGARWRRYGPEQGLALGALLSLQVHGRHVWAGGEGGLALFATDRFHPLLGADGENFHGVSGMVELDNGDLWVNAFAGLFRIARAEIAKFERSADYRVRATRLDQLDGLEGSAPKMPSPSLVLAADGRLWLVRSAGLFRLNPAEPAPAMPGLPVIVKTLGPPGARRPLQQPLRLAPDSSALQIDYALPALSIPERLRFRYRLHEVDSGWQEVGARRSAYYSNLAPGEYHFSVAASDYDGRWSDTVTSVAFAIAPTYTQTWWFKALCAIGALLALALACRWYVRRMGRQMASRLQERIDERERIARELHDTLLQSVQGLVLHVHVALLKLPPADAARRQIETALDLAEQVLDEGRGRIRDLRGETGGNLSFADAVLAGATRMQHGDGCPLRLTIFGAVRKLDAMIHNEALAILTEAVANARIHAQASRIDAELHYGSRAFRCVLSDDGVGIPDAVLSEGGRQDHWGMRGMYERAARINARLVVRSGSGSGTAWELDIPAMQAYR